jgi:hypothetical protein
LHKLVNQSFAKNFHALKVQRRSVGNESYRAVTLDKLGSLLTDTGRAQEARSCWTSARAVSIGVIRNKP